MVLMAGLCAGCLQHYRNESSDPGADELLQCTFVVTRDAGFTIAESRPFPTVITRESSPKRLAVLQRGTLLRVSRLIEYRRDLAGSGILVYAAKAIAPLGPHDAEHLYVVAP